MNIMLPAAVMAAALAVVPTAATTTVEHMSDIIHSADQLALVGRPAVLTRVDVERIAGARSFWIGDRNGRRILVVVDATSLQNELGSRRGLRDGDRVAIHGTIERVPGTSHDVSVMSWGRLDRTDAKALSKDDVYVYARRVTLLAH